MSKRRERISSIAPDAASCMSSGLSCNMFKIDIAVVDTTFGLALWILV
ncbi:hypothetical protein [Cloacibacillus porcorum]|nr:hypothetical protein [Cloacibacillus porcorum]